MKRALFYLPLLLTVIAMAQKPAPKRPNIIVILAGATYPKEYKGHAITPTTGISIAPTFSGKKVAGHETVFNEHFGARYAREGNWKLVGTSNVTPWHLYNLETDRTETNDVAAQYPGKVKHLDSLWRTWANTHQVFPKPQKRK